MVCGAEWMIMLQSAWIIALLSHWRLTDKCLYAGEYSCNRLGLHSAHFLIYSFSYHSDFLMCLLPILADVQKCYLITSKSSRLLGFTDFNICFMTSITEASQGNISIVWVLESIPAIIRRDPGYTLDKSPS